MKNRGCEDHGLFWYFLGPLSAVRACKHCSHVETVRRILPGRGALTNPLGRGYGMSEGNKARGRMIQHVKAAHPEFYAAQKGKKS